MDSGCWHAEAPATAKPIKLVVAAALVDTDGRVLIAKRPEGKHMGALWEFPGGKVGARETPETALVRELHEELGVDTKESCLAPFAFASLWERWQAPDGETVESRTIITTEPNELVAELHDRMVVNRKRLKSGGGERAADGARG